MGVRSWIHRAVLASALGAPGASLSASTAPAIRQAEFIYTTAPYPQAHASTLTELPDGTLAAAWFGGSGEGKTDVSIWFARRSPTGWQVPRAVANGSTEDGRRFPTWNPVLFQPQGGDLLLFYKVGPSPREWWGMVVSSSDGGRTWARPRRLPDGVLGPIKNKPVVAPDGAWLSPSSREEGTASDNRWSLRIERSTDHGKTWRVGAAIASPLHIEAIQPSILFHPDGSLEIVARTRQGAVAMSWSFDDGVAWSPLAAIDLPNPNSGIDAVTLRDGRQLIVYNHSAHSPDTPGQGRRWPLNIGISIDGIRWRNVLTLDNKPLAEGYAYPSVIQTRDGLVHITYTRNRTMIRHVVVDPRLLH